MGEKIDTAKLPWLWDLHFSWLLGTLEYDLVCNAPIFPMYPVAFMIALRHDKAELYCCFAGFIRILCHCGTTLIARLDTLFQCPAQFNASCAASLIKHCPCPWILLGRLYFLLCFMKSCITTALFKSISGDEKMWEKPDMGGDYFCPHSPGSIIILGHKFYNAYIYSFFGSMVSAITERRKNTNFSSNWPIKFCLMSWHGYQRPWSSREFGHKRLTLTFTVSPWIAKVVF